VPVHTPTGRFAQFCRAWSPYAGLTGTGRAYVVAIVIAGLVTLIWQFPPDLPNPMLFAALLLASSLASSHRVRLPLVSSSSTLSVSYAIDFAALFLVGTNLTMH
jgi:hypothetical protein